MRNATYAERALWGTCPTCNAPHGHPCDAGDNRIWGEWVHKARLVKAPYKVKLVSADTNQGGR